MEFKDEWWQEIGKFFVYGIIFLILVSGVAFLFSSDTPTDSINNVVESVEKRNIQEQRTSNGQLQAVKSENLERENIYLNYSLSLTSDGDTDTGYMWLNKENDRVKYTIVGDTEKSSIYEIKDRMISCGDIHTFDGGCEVVSNQRSLLFRNLASINASDYQPLIDTVEVQEKDNRKVDGQKAYCYEISASNGTELNLTRNVCLGSGNGLPVKMETEVETFSPFDRRVTADYEFDLVDHAYQSKDASFELPDPIVEINERCEDGDITFRIMSTREYTREAEFSMTYEENQTTPVNRTRDVDLEPYEEEKFTFQTDRNPRDYFFGINFPDLIEEKGMDVYEGGKCQPITWG